MADLTPKQLRFVDEYLVDLNGTQAAIRAGYAKRSARVQATRLLANAAIGAAVAARREELSKGAALSRERILRELGHIAVSDLRRLYREDGSLKPMHELEEADAAAIASVEVDEIEAGPRGERAVIGYTRKVRRFDKVRALELLGRHAGLWLEQKPPAPDGPGLTVIVQQAPATPGGPAASQVVVTLQPPETA